MAAPPLSRVEALKEEARSALPRSPRGFSVSLEQCLLVARRLSAVAAAADAEGRDELAFVMYYRLALFITQFVSLHAAFGQPAFALDARWARQAAHEAEGHARRLRAGLCDAEAAAAAVAEAIMRPLSKQVHPPAQLVPPEPLPQPPLLTADAATVSVPPWTDERQEKGEEPSRRTPSPPHTEHNMYAALAGLTFSRGVNAGGVGGGPEVGSRRGVGDYSGGGGGGTLMALHCSTHIFGTFEGIAAPNSLRGPRGIETCGVVCGRKSARWKNALEVTHLMIPRQTGEADSCEMHREDELLEACLAHNVLILGWIHTHPSQTCFLSSLDMHTHCSYQCMLPEAVAIVVAPRDAGRPWAVFRLTDGPHGGGLRVIQACKKDGFHPHDAAGGDDGALYEASGHVVLHDDLPLAVIDLREQPAAGGGGHGFE